MTARGAGILGSVSFVLLLALGSYLLDVPLATVLVATVFAIAVILWVGTRDSGSAARSFSAEAGGESSSAAARAKAGSEHGSAPVSEPGSGPGSAAGS